MTSKGFTPHHLRYFNFRSKDKYRFKKPFVRIFSFLKNGEGFTLIELMIYIGLVSMVLFVVINFSWQVVYGSVKWQASREIQHNAWFSLEKITKEIQVNNNPEIFYVSDGTLFQSGIPLTTDQIKVTHFTITSLANSYLIEVTLEYKNPGARKEYESKISLRSTVALLPKEPPSVGCWGTGGMCDSSCKYLSFGFLANYYTDPGCAALCSPAGYFYLNPSGVCSNNGNGVCYKMTPTSLSRNTVCSQGAGCAFQCAGTCTPCGTFLNRDQCLRQGGCRWSGGTCRGNCTSCNTFLNQTSCQNQSGCSWNILRWYWNLENLKEGYPSYINCEWYIQN